MSAMKMPGKSRINIVHLAVLILVTLSMSLTVLAQDSQDLTINIDYTSTEDDGTGMQMTLPLSMIEIFRPQIEEALASAANDESVDFREIWSTVRAGEPSQFVEINDADTEVRVSTTETELLVSIFEREGNFRSDVTIPLAFGDALFSQATSDLSADDVIATLAGMAGTDLVRISGNKINGRIWIE